MGYKRTFSSGINTVVGKLFRLSAFGAVGFLIWTVAQNVSRFA